MLNRKWVDNQERAKIGLLTKSNAYHKSLREKTVKTLHSMWNSIWRVPCQSYQLDLEKTGNPVQLFTEATPADSVCVCVVFLSRRTFSRVSCCGRKSTGVTDITVGQGATTLRPSLRHGNNENVTMRLGSVNASHQPAIPLTDGTMKWPHLFVKYEEKLIFIWSTNKVCGQRCVWSYRVKRFGPMEQLNEACSFLNFVNNFLYIGKTSRSDRFQIRFEDECKIKLIITNVLTLSLSTTQSKCNG